MLIRPSNSQPRLRAPDGTRSRLYLLSLHAPFTALAHPLVVKPRVQCAGDAAPDQLWLRDDRYTFELRTQATRS